jgi:hypothetical protein
MTASVSSFSILQGLAAASMSFSCILPVIEADHQWTPSCLQHGHPPIHLESVYGLSECKLEIHVLFQADNQGRGHDGIDDPYVCALVEC